MGGKSIKTNKIFFCLVMVLGFLSLVSIARAQSNTSTLATPEEAKKETSAFHILLNATTSSNMYAEGSQREMATELLINPSYKLAEKMTLSSKGVLSRDNNTSEDTQEGNSSISNVSLTLGFQGPVVGPELKTTYAFSGIAPTNETSRKRDRLKGAAAVAGGIKGTWKRLTAGYGISLQRNFHEFNINAAGQANVEYSLTQTLSQEIDLSSGWSLSFEEMYRQGRTYRNFQRQTYGFGADINYEITKQWAANVGWANEGAALKPNGTESNVELYDENTSTIHIGITFLN